MRIEKSNRVPFKLTVLALMLSVLFSCKKDVQGVQNESTSGQVNPANNLEGLSIFLQIPELDKTLKASIDTNNYHHFSKSSTDHLWIISLKPGTYGFSKAKIVANLKDGKFTMIIASYNYNTEIYKKGDFSTYTGTTSLYNQRLQKLKDYVYEQGKLKEIKVPDCPTCVVFVVPDVDPMWCDTYDPVCQGQYGDTDDLDNLMVNPDGGGGGGGDIEDLSGQLVSAEPEPIYENDPNDIWWDPSVSDPNTDYIQQPVPTYDNVYKNYPTNADKTDDMPVAQVVTLIGGQVLDKYYAGEVKNACALRVSRALLYSGVTIPSIANQTWTGADGKNYFFRAEHLFNWMNKTFPNKIHKTAADGAPDGTNFKSYLAGYKGVYIMKPKSKTDFRATGHATLWGGINCIGGHNYFAAASDVYLFILK